jgi:hypothetical protein
MKSYLTASVMGLAMIVGVGCANQTEGEKTLERADRLEEAGNTISRGEQLIVDGKAAVGRGEALRDQGNRLEGEKMIAEGKAKISQGEKLVAEGKAMRNR